MDNKGKKIATGVLAAVISGSIAMTATSALAGKKDTEKCYGVVKAKKNDCGTPRHSCAGQATVDNDPAEWIYMLKGNCARIGGSLTPGQHADEAANSQSQSDDSSDIG